MLLDGEEWLKPHEVADIFRVDESQVRTWIRKGKLQERNVRVRQEDNGHFFMHKEDIYDLWSDSIE